MPFIIKNKRDHEVKVGITSFAPHQQLEFHSLEASVIGEKVSNDIQNALDRGDLEIVGDSTPTAAERKADVDAINDGVEKMRHIAED